jgi:hypothetical protein
MDLEKKVQNLLYENEFLQEQLEDLNKTIAKKDEELLLLNDNSESEASIRSRMEINLVEIKHVKATMEAANNRAAAIEAMNEELEGNLVDTMKARQKDKAIIKALESNQSHVNILNEELNETAVYYNKLKKLKSEYTAQISENEILKLENNTLRDELREMKSLVEMLKQKKLDNL